MGLPCVDVIAYGEADSGALAIHPDTPPVDVARAKPEQDSVIDLADSERLPD
jgi:hypothetical protein